MDETSQPVECPTCELETLDEEGACPVCGVPDAIPTVADWPDEGPSVWLD